MLAVVVDAPVLGEDLGLGQARELFEVQWREEGLRVPQKTRKRRRTGDPAARWLRAERPNQLWALDYQYDQTSDARMLRRLNIVDEFTRAALVIKVGRSITTEQTVAALQALVAERGCPENIRCDNRPELTAHALRDWCRSASVTTNYIEPAGRYDHSLSPSVDRRTGSGQSHNRLRHRKWDFDCRHRF
jgi:putative transposase